MADFFLGVAIAIPGSLALVLFGGWLGYVCRKHAKKKDRLAYESEKKKIQAWVDAPGDEDVKFLLKYGLKDAGIDTNVIERSSESEDSSSLK